MPAAISASGSKLKKWFWFVLLLNALFIVGSKYYLAPLGTGEVVQFETAKHLGKAQSIIDDWKANGKFENAVESVWIDFFFIPLYVLLLMLGAMYLSDVTHHPLLMRSGRFFRWLLPAAGICDVFENVFMLRSLESQPSKITVLLTYDMAVAKFSILIVTLIFLILCLFFWAMRKLFPAVG